MSARNHPLHSEGKRCIRCLTHPSPPATNPAPRQRAHSLRCAREGNARENVGREMQDGTRKGLPVETPSAGAGERAPRVKHEPALVLALRMFPMSTIAVRANQNRQPEQSPEHPRPSVAPATPRSAGSASPTSCALAGSAQPAHDAARRPNAAHAAIIPHPAHLSPELRADIVQAKYDLIYWVVGAFVLTNVAQVTVSFMRH